MFSSGPKHLGDSQGSERTLTEEQLRPVLERALSKPYRYPRAGYETVRLARRVALTPPLANAAAAASLPRR